MHTETASLTGKLLHKRKVHKADQNPGYESQEGHPNDERDEVAADLICKLLDGSLRLESLEEGDVKTNREVRHADPVHWIKIMHMFDSHDIKNR